MPNQQLSSLAILKVKADRGEDYIDSFVPFVVELVERAGVGSTTFAELQKAMLSEFGLEVPQGALSTIARRAERRKLIQRTATGLRPLRADDAVRDAKAESAHLLEDFRALVRDLADYVSGDLGLTWSEDIAEEAILSFVSEHAATALDVILRRQLPDGPAFRGEADYAVAKYMTERLQQPLGNHVRALDDLMKAALLSGALLFPDLSAVQRRFESTTVFLDTRFVIPLLGLEGDVAQRPRREATLLASRLGARVAIYRHIVDEIHGVLSAARTALLDRSRLQGSWGPTIRYMIDARWNAGDVELQLVTLEQRIREVGVSVEDVLPYGNDHSNAIDERGLGDYLDDQIAYSRGPARDNDVQSLSSIYRSRRGVTSESIDRCRALFVTTNTALVHAARQFFSANYPSYRRDGVIPVGMSADLFTGMCWLKKPQDAPELPRLQVLADALSILQPPDNLWRKWSDTLGQMTKDGTVSQDVADTLRYSLAARNALMDQTHGDIDALSDDNIDEVIARAVGVLRGEADDELGQTRVNRREL